MKQTIDERWPGVVNSFDVDTDRCVFFHHYDELCPTERLNISDPNILETVKSQMLYIFNMITMIYVHLTYAFDQINYYSR